MECVRSITYCRRDNMRILHITHIFLVPFKLGAIICWALGKESFKNVLIFRGYCSTLEAVYTHMLE